MAGCRETLDFPLILRFPADSADIPAPDDLEDLNDDIPQEPKRIDQFLVAHIPGLSRSRADQWLKSGRVFVNDNPITKKSQLIAAGDTVRIEAPDADATASEQPAATLSGDPLFSIRPRPLEGLDILFEDDDVIVINKSAGLVVHPGAGTAGQTTMVEGLMHHLGREGLAHSSSPDDLRPGIVHRLDKDTTGAIVWAKHPEAQRDLAKQFQDRTNLREYIALLIGGMDEPVTAVSYQYRDPFNRLRKANMSERDYQEKTEAGADLKGYRRAVSHFTPIKTYSSWLSLVRVRLETGRTHQIRSHALWLGRPVLGDPLYGRELTAGQKQQLPASCRKLVAALSRQMLHGRLLGFSHPGDGRKLAFQAPFAPDMKALLTALDDASA